MNFKKRLKGAAAVGVLSAMIIGPQAFASSHVDESTATVTVAAVSGERSLALTASNATGELALGNPTLAFNSATASAPFGVLVTDLAYQKKGYEASATLSDLYPIDPTSGVQCAGTPIESSSFNISYLPATASSALDTVLKAQEAIVQPTVQFVATEADLNTVLGPILGGLSVTGDRTVTAVGNVLTETFSAATLMDVANGGTGSFTAQAGHPTCGNAAGTPTPVVLQDGTPASSPDLSTLSASLITGVTGVTSAIAADLFDSTDATKGGAIWNATQSMLESVLTSLGLGTLGLTDQMVTDMVAQLEQPTITNLDLLGQSGAYINAPSLNLTQSLTGVDTGLYSGQLTVTLFDKP